MGEIVQGNFRRDRDDAYDCPAFGEVNGETVPCAQLLDRPVFIDGVEISNDEKIALCAASLSITDELTSPSSCGFQKFTKGTETEQVRIRSIVGAQNA